MLTRARGPLYDLKVRALEIVVGAEKAGAPISATELRDQLGADITGPDWKAIRSHVEKSGGKLRRIIPLPWTDAQRAEVVSLYLAGNSMRQIGALYGRPDHAVEEVIRRAREDGQTIPKRQGAQPARGVKLREDQIADALAARLDTPAMPAGSGGGEGVHPPASPPPVLSCATQSLMQRGLSLAEARYQARMHSPRPQASAQEREPRRVVPARPYRIGEGFLPPTDREARQAEQVAARSARQSLQGQSRFHRSNTMPGANR